MNNIKDQKIKDLSTAIQEGLNSGISKDFDPEAFLREMKKSREEKFLLVLSAMDLYKIQEIYKDAILKVVDILILTFKELDIIYKSQVSLNSNSNSSSLLLFPKYREDDNIRVSEQELRFIFVEQFDQYCKMNNWNVRYSVETPTHKKYIFSNIKGENKPVPRIADNSDEGVSARFDVTINDEMGSILFPIEFKANNPDELSFKKDLFKLVEDSNTNIGFLVLLLKSADIRTYRSIFRKVLSNIGVNTIFVCHCLPHQEKERDSNK